MTTVPYNYPPPCRRQVGPGARVAGFSLGATLAVLALVTGLNFTFATAVMPNLNGLDDRTFVLITQRFNENPVFPVTFTLALLLLILTVVLQATVARGPAMRWTILTVVLYAIVLAITGAIHMPLNDLINGAGDPDDIAAIGQLRERFEASWVIWNAVRTVVCTAALCTLIRAAMLH